MTKEDLEKAQKLDMEIKKLTFTIQSIGYGLANKKCKDKEARRIIEYKEKHNTHNEEWTLGKFFRLIFEKRNIKVIPHYEFARAIEVDAEPELVDLILGYFVKKKEALEKEFKQIGGGIE